MDPIDLFVSPKPIERSSNWPSRPYSGLVGQPDYGRLASPAKATRRVRSSRPSGPPERNPDRPLPTCPPPKTYTATEVLRWDPNESPPFEPDGLVYRFPLDAVEYCKLVEQLETSGQAKAWPRYEYDGRNGMGIVQLMPSAIHGKVHSLISSAIVKSLALQPEVAQARFLAQTGVNQKLRDGNNVSSTRCADLELVENMVSDEATVFVLECGFSQSYQSLLNTVYDWFRGRSSIRMVMLVDVQEEPRYRNSLKDVDANIIIERFQNARLSEVTESVPGQPWAGYTLRGEKFVGSLRCYLECWIRGSDNGPKLREPRHQFVPAEANEVPLQLHFGELSDFQLTRDLVVELNWDQIRAGVWQGARHQALNRGIDIVDNALKSVGMADHEFLPSRQS